MPDFSIAGRICDQLQVSHNPIAEAVSRLTNAICDNNIFEARDQIALATCGGVGRSTCTGRRRVGRRLQGSSGPSTPQAAEHGSRRAPDS